MSYFFYKEIFHGKSLGRAMLFSALIDLFNEEKQLKADLNILEIGAEPASYHRALPGGWKIKNSNYKMIKKTDIIIDAEKNFPLNNNEFDGVIIFNVLYILKNYYNCLSECLRVSKSFILFNVPLICGLVPQPTDYNRFTKEKLISLIDKLKQEQKIKDYRLIPIGGSFSAAIGLIDIYLRFRIIKIPIYLLAIFFDKLDKIFNRDCPNMYLVLIKKI